MKRTLLNRSIRLAILLFLFVLLAISVQAGAQSARGIVHATVALLEKVAFAAAPG